MKQVLSTVACLVCFFIAQGQVSQKEFDRYLNALYPSHEVELIKAFFDGNTVDSLYLYGLIEIGGKKFYRMSHEELYFGFVNATISKLPKQNWKKGEALIKATELDLLDTLEVQDMEKDVWTVYRAGLYPTPNVPNYMKAVGNILNQNGVSSSGLGNFSDKEMDKTLSQLNGYPQFKAYLYWFYHLLSVNRKEVINRYFPGFIKRAVDNVSMTPDEFCFVYLASGKLVNSLDYEKNFTYAIQLFSTARLYHAEGNGSLDERIAIAAIIAESINNLPGWEAKQRAFDITYRFFLQNRHLFNTNQEMKCYVLLAKYGIEMRESKEFETGIKDRDMTVPLYNYKCYDYFSQVGGPYYLMTIVNIIKQMRVDGKYHEMAHFALHAFESSFGSQETQNSRLISFIVKSFRLSDYYLNDIYSHSHTRYKQRLRELGAERKISKEQVEKLSKSVTVIHNFDNNLRKMGVSGDFLYFFWKINEIEFLFDEDNEQKETLDLNDLANSKVPFSGYYFRNIFKFLPASKLQGEGFETPKEAIMSLHRLFYKVPDQVGEVQYYLGYQLSQSEGTLAIHKKKLELYDLNESNVRLGNLSDLLSDSIVLQQDEIGTLNIQSRQKDSTIASKEDEVENLSADILGLKQEKKKAEEELIFTQKTVWVQRIVLTFISLLLIIIAILLLRAQAQKTREEILSWTNNQLSHFGKRVPLRIKHHLEEALGKDMSLSLDYELNKLSRLSGFFSTFYKGSRSSTSSVSHELDLIRQLVEIEFGTVQSGAVEDKIKSSLGSDSILIPKFSLFNLIYNSFNHGYIHKVNGGEVLVKVSKKQGWYQFLISDNGNSIREKLPETGVAGTGIGYVKKRIRWWNKYLIPTRFSHGKTESGYQVSFNLLKRKDGL